MMWFVAREFPLKYSTINLRINAKNPSGWSDFVQIDTSMSTGKDNTINHRALQQATGVAAVNRAGGT
jgi:hypothetical protein